MCIRDRLCAAAKGGDVTILAWLVEDHGMHINSTVGFSMKPTAGQVGRVVETVVGLAVYHGRQDAVAWLVSKGAD
eukprot:3593563-Rhodomonas_salina.1